MALLCRLNADWVATIDCLEVPRLTVLAASMCSMCDVLNADDLDGRREPPVLAKPSGNDRYLRTPHSVGHQTFDFDR